MSREPRFPLPVPTPAPAGSSAEATQISGRKADHITLCATEDVGFRAQGTLLGDVRLVHDALPELSSDEVELAVTLFGTRLKAPIVIAAMTGGTEEAARINRTLAAIAEERGYGFGLGSQRAMLIDAGKTASYRIRDVAPSTLLLANLGAVQLVQEPTAKVAALVEAVGAQAICIHLNPAMELVQPEGDRDFRGILAAIERLRRELPCPVVVKETGCGLGPATARKLRSIGVAHVDVSGAGGTSWVGVETRRARGRDPRKFEIGEAFWDWGIPTAVTTRICAAAGFETVIATGGITSGLDVARAVTLGAHAAGLARPVLRALHEGGPEGARAFLDQVETELRTAMVLTGTRTISELRAHPTVVTGELSEWLRGLGVSSR